MPLGGPAQKQAFVHTSEGKFQTRVQHIEPNTPEQTLLAADDCHHTDDAEKNK